MKDIYILMKSVVAGQRSSQDRALDYIKNDKNIKKAAKGSMQKRLKLIERVELMKRSA